MTYEFIKENPNQGEFSSVVLLEDGTLPNDLALSYQNDTDTGLFRPADNSFSVATGGVERMRINSEDTTFYERVKEQSFFNTGYYATMRDALPVMKNQQCVIDTLTNWANPISVAGSLSSWRSIAYSESLKRYVAISESTTALYSNDGGNNWIATAIVNRNYYRVVWQNNLFFALVVGSTSYYSTSPDGITWTERSLPVSGNWRDLIWLPSYNRFLLCNSATGSRIYYSTDGLTWSDTVVGQTVVQPTVNSQYSLAYSPELNIVVSVQAVSTEEVAYSRNGGLSWTEISITNGSLRDVCWAKEVNLFVAVGDAGRTFYSENGINWIAGTGLTASRLYYKVMWIPELHIFLTSQYTTGSGSTELSYSFDGKVWNGIQIAGNDYQINTGLSYSPQFGNIVWCSQGESGGVATNRERFFITKLNSRWPTSENVFNHAFNSINDDGVWNFNDVKVNGDLITSKSRWRNINGSGNPAILDPNLDDEHSSFYFDGSFSFNRFMRIPVLTAGQHHTFHFHLDKRTSGTGGTFHIRFQQNFLYVNENQLITASVGTPFDLAIAQSNNLTHMSGSFYIHFPSSFDDPNFPTSAYRVPYLIRLTQSNLTDNFSRIFLRGGSQSEPALSFSTPEVGTNTGIFNRVNGELNISTDNVERLRVANTFVRSFQNIQAPDGTQSDPSLSFTNATGNGLYLTDTSPFNLGISVNGSQKINIKHGTGVDNVSVFNTRIDVPESNNTNPAITFSGSQTHGIYCDNTNDIMSFKVGNVAVMNFSPTTSSIVSQLSTRSIINNTYLLSTGSNQTIDRLDTIVYGTFMYELTANIDVELPTSMTSADVGLTIKIGKNSGSHTLTIKTNGTDLLNNSTTGSTTISSGAFTFRECLLVKVVSGVSHWVSQI